MSKLCQTEGILKAHDFFRAENEQRVIAYILEEYAPCLIDDMAQREDITYRMILGYILDICDCLHRCDEKGIFYPDIKPHNFFVSPPGKALLGDFGHALFRSELGGVTLAIGTPNFMAPELYNHGKKYYSEVSQVYSLGISLYFLVSGGRYPFDLRGRNPAVRKVDDVFSPLNNSPAELTEIINKACAYYEEDRYWSIKDFTDALEEFRASSLADGIIAAFAKGEGQADTHASPLTPPYLEETLPEEPEKESVSPLGSVLSDLFNTRRKGKTLLSKYKTLDLDPLALSCAIDPDGGENTLPDYLILPEDEAPAEQTQAPPLDSVRFSVVTPKAALREEGMIITIFMFEEAWSRAADEYISQQDTPMKKTETGFFNVFRKTEVKITLTSPDITIEDGEESFIWEGKYGSLFFYVDIPGDYKKSKIFFIAKVCFEGLPVTRIKFLVDVAKKEVIEEEITREDIKKALMSYASQDRSRITAVIQGMKKINPELDIFLDVDSLRSGDNWEKRIYEEIEKRDILYLCWSHYAKASEWVEKEWRYAYENKGEEFIEPIPLEPPDVCKPPEELKGKHFNDRELLFRKDDLW